MPEGSPLDRFPTWLLLAIAVAGEVAGTASLRLSEGMTRPGFAIGVVALYGGSIAIFGRVLVRGIALGVAYGVLTATGLIAAAGLSVVAFGEPLTLVQAGGIVVLGAGIWLLQRDAA